jgi:hypothetical protein
MENYLANIGYIVSNDDLEHRIDDYISLNNQCISDADSNLEFLVFENELAFDSFQKHFYQPDLKLKDKYYFIAMIGSIMKLYFGLIIPLDNHRNIGRYYPLFQNKFQQINHRFN